MPNGEAEDHLREVREAAARVNMSPVGRVVPFDPVSPPPLPPGAKRTHWLRHGQAEHNAAGDQLLEEIMARGGTTEEWISALHILYTQDDMLDPSLTEKGRRQAEGAKKAASGLLVEMVVSSPLQRCLGTATLVFHDTHRALFMFTCHRLLVEAQANRRGRSVIAAEYPHFDFGLVTDEEDVSFDRHVRETRDALILRGADFVRWVLSRPEDDIAIVAHSSFMLTAFNGGVLDTSAARELEKWFEPGELRHIVLHPS